MDNIISILSGSESIPGAGSTTKLQVLTTNHIRIGLDNKPMSSDTMVAGRGLRREVAGELRNHSYNIPDGTEICAIGERQYLNGGPVQMKRMLLRVDHRAPYNRVSVPTSGCDRSVASKLYVEGRFWIVMPEEFKTLRAALPSYENPFAVFNPVEELHPGAPEPKVETKTVTIEGEQTRVTFSRPKRALRL